MNANELAEGILAIEERIFLTKKEHQLFQNSATMLRQQQAEIEALKDYMKAQDEHIVDLAFKLVYAERGNEVAKELSK